ncbi:hypothetical protein ACFWA9_10265 [Kitasatospora sp. NPDC059973]|uniref:hypothetical protein n=1 Tax=Kitasatospora sp. NPDC059973 TaxID=3347020 RepID=UPI0036BB83D8
MAPQTAPTSPQPYPPNAGNAQVSPDGPGYWMAPVGLRAPAADPYAAPWDTPAPPYPMYDPYAAPEIKDRRPLIDWERVRRARRAIRPGYVATVAGLASFSGASVGWRHVLAKCTTEEGAHLAAVHIADSGPGLGLSFMAALVLGAAVAGGRLRRAVRLAAAVGLAAVVTGTLTYGPTFAQVTALIAGGK